MDETEFRARVRERSHHTLEIQVYATAYRHQKLKPNQADYTKHLLELWEKRGLGKNLPEYRYAAFLIDAAEKLVKGEDVDLTPYKPTPVTEQMEKDFFTIVKERRSVREFKDKEVPDELIDKILEAGLWAAHGCNVQSIRYVVVREKNEPGLFRGSDVPGGPVHLVILQDMRCYRELLQDGNNVLIVGRNPKTLEETGKELAGAATYSCDAGKAEETTGLVDAVKNGKIAGFGDNVDGLILCAAVFPNPATKTSVVQPEPEELQAMLDSNVTAYYRLVKEFLPLLAPGSRIVLIGSTSGIRRDRGGIYGISKWALRSYAYALREECKPMGIGVSLINPGGTFTETRKKSSEEDRSLLETSDLGKVITLTFRLSPQAVLEEVNIRPLQGDTY